MRLEFKITTWGGCDIDDKHKDALLAFLKENPKASATEIFGWASKLDADLYVEIIEGADEEIAPEENNGYATIEVVDSHGKTLFQNGK